MSKLEIFKEMIGESHSEFVAGSLRETYEDLQNELELIEDVKNRTPIWDYDNDTEKEEINKMLNALELVYSWYSTEEL
jgi:molybdopterin synthase catalytic subunit